MKIIYIHGLDSSAQSVKGQLLEQFCKSYYPNVDVLLPDLNVAPAKVLKKLSNYVKEREGKDILFMGSSLGGYFASLISNKTGTPAVLLNPSTQPHLSLKRFIDSHEPRLDSDLGAFAESARKPEPDRRSDLDNRDAHTVIYQTSGGWEMTYADIQWFNEHKLDSMMYPEKVLVVIKENDELLNSKIAIDFYSGQGAKVIVQKGGDHRMTDFAEQLPLIFEHLAPFMSSEGLINR